MSFKEFGVMPRKFEEQNGLLKKQKLSWQNFRNGFMVGYDQAMKEYNVLEIIESLEQVLNEALDMEENQFVLFDVDLDKVKEELKKAKEEWQQ